MTNIILAAIMFCMIVFLCAISFLCGFFAAVKLKMPSKTDTEPLTQEQKNDIEQKRKEYMNFLSYNGKEQ